MAKTTFLLGGNPDPGTRDEDTREIAEACFDAAEQHDLVFHFHTSAGGTSDTNKFVPLIERYGKRIKIYLVHIGARWLLTEIEKRGVGHDRASCSPPTSRGATSGASTGRSGASR